MQGVPLPESIRTGEGATVAKPQGVLRSLQLLATNPGALNRAYFGSVQADLSLPFKTYGVGAALGLGLSEVLGESNTGALYVFGGGVFGKVAGVGEWIAFAVLVPVLAGALHVLHRRSGLAWRDHLVFALHFGAVAGLGTAVETLLVWSTANSSLASFAAWPILLIVAVHYVLAIRDTYGSEPAEVLKGGVAAGALFAVWAGAALLLWQFTDFTL